MKNYYKSTICLLSVMLFIALAINKSIAGVGDTTVVQTLRYDTNMRGGVFMFPTDTAKTYQKIIMLYGMRCKNGLISTPGSGPTDYVNRNKGCGEWDYNCYTYMVDSFQTDSLHTVQGSYAISNYTDSVFSYTSSLVYAYTQYTQQAVNYTSIISQDSAILGTDNAALLHPFNTATSISRSQYLWTGAELTSAGLTAGNITGLRLDLSSLGSAINNLRIRIKNTTQTALNENNPETTGFTEVYFLNTALASTGITNFNFSAPFNWNGTGNIIVDFSFDNVASGANNEVLGHDYGSTVGLINTQPDTYLNADGSITLMNINPSVFPTITNQITVAFWVHGDSAKLPANTSILEGRDNTNNRQINIHLPWSDSNIYWDCGNDGTGYDRISKAATTAEIEGKWNFWAFTKNASTGVMNIYLNGALWSSGTGKTKLIDIETMVAGMGMDAGNIYRGGYDEFSIWNKALSLASIQQIMNKDITNAHPDYSNLLAYYKLNEGAGTTATDASPNGYNSPITNPAWRSHRGNNLFRNFSNTTFRPNATFVKGVYTSTVQNYTVLDSALANTTSVISYSVSNNSLDVIDTVYVWQATYAYIYNAAGVKMDSIAIAPQNTITVVPLTYYRKRPMRIELINFITPYGINLDLNGLGGKVWEFDVTDYAPLLRGARYLAMEDGKFQEENDIKFVFYEGTPPRNVKSISQIWPSGTWVSPSYTEIYNNVYFEPRTVFLDANAAQFKVRSSISGHGQQGEFIARNHTIKLNNAVNFSRSVWKECATNPIYPQGGTWVYDRAGWCPGAGVDVKEFEITPNVTPGTNITLDYTLPVLASPGASNYRVNNQLVSYGAPNFTLDAAADYVKSPSNRTEFIRFNALCNQPVISIKNTGSTTLTSLDITYGRVGCAMSTYQWTGSLIFLDSVEVTLPAPNWIGSSVNQFMAIVSNPNGAADQYAYNDTMYSTFNIPVVYPSELIFELKTNNQGNGTNYTLKDAAGNNVINRTGLGNNITYKDTVYLNYDCYTVKLNDVGDDGLSWWANTSQGTGYFRIRDLATNTILTTFNPDFGDNIYQQFTVDYSLLSVEPIVESIQDLSIYPNPASTEITAVFKLPLQAKAKIKLLNVLGEQLLTETVMVSNKVEKVTMDVSTLANGIYFVVLHAGDQTKIKKLVIAK